jgi:16S rRNA G966 N2-methylase RsmD
MQPYHKLVRADVLGFIKNHSAAYDVIFAGPPYALSEIDEIPNMIFENNLLSPDGVFIMETSPKHNFENNPNLVDVRNYGQTHFWFFKHYKEVKNQED